MRRFVILAVPRTGSNLLCTLLDSHPEILCHHEVFNPQGVFVALSHRHRPGGLPSMDQRDAAPRAFLEQVWQTGRGYRCVGFKWTRGQSPAPLEFVVNDPGVLKIVLRRRNRVKTYVSAEIAQRTRQWEVYGCDELIQPRPRVAVDPTRMRKQIAEDEQFYARLDATLQQSHQPSCQTTYERLLCPQEHRRLLERMGVRDVDYPLQAASIKQNPADLRESIVNFSELARHLAGSDLEAELRDCSM